MIVLQRPPDQPRVLFQPQLRVIGSRMAHPQKYRNGAARLRNEANSHTPDEIQRQLLEIADQYERLAVKLEEMRQAKP
jgi:hypothetical protein